MRKLEIISNHFSIVFYAALFNLILEYAGRGIIEFITRPLFALSLFGIYFTYYLLLEDLMVRFKLKNYQIILVAFFYGMILLAFFTGNLFNQEIYGGIIFAGINIVSLLMIGIITWGITQGILTLYFANRLSPRDWNHPKLGKIGWAAAILFQFAMLIIAQMNPVTPRGSLVGYVVWGTLMVVSGGLIFKSLKNSKREAKEFHPSQIMDFLAFGSVILYLVLGTFFAIGPTIITSQPISVISTTAENIWVFFVGVVYIIYRVWRKSDVTV